MRNFNWQEWTLFLTGLLIFGLVMATRREIPNIWVRAIVVGLTASTLCAGYQALVLQAKNRRR
jgi:hypothetical protein